MLNKIQNFLRDESGATAVEYGLIAALISIGIIAGATSLGSSLDAGYTKAAEGFPT